MLPDAQKVPVTARNTRQTPYQCPELVPEQSATSENVTLHKSDPSCGFGTKLVTAYMVSRSD
eukprot:6188653-Pleurochrysis_carterae.AAC.1